MNKKQNWVAAFCPRLAGIGLSLLVLGLACTPSTPVILSAKYEPPRTFQGIVHSRRICFVRLTDLRRDKTTEGLVAGRPVQAPSDSIAWMQSVLGGLSGWGIQADFGKGANGVLPAAVAECELVTAWISSASTTMTANVVFRIRFLHMDGSVEEHLYRGEETVVNWASGHGEIQSLMNMACWQALAKMADGIRART